MPYRNSYAGLAVIEEKPWYSETPAEEYDLNFAYSVPQEDLSTRAALIRPLIVRFLLVFFVSLSASPFVEPVKLTFSPCSLRFTPLGIFNLRSTVSSPLLIVLVLRLHQLLNVANPPGGYAFLPYGPFPSYPSFLSWLEKIRRDPEALLFVVYDLALDLGNGDDDLKEGQTLREERIAGVVGVLHSRAWDRMTEVGVRRLRFLNSFRLLELTLLSHNLDSTSTSLRPSNALTSSPTRSPSSSAGSSTPPPPPPPPLSVSAALNGSQRAPTPLPSRQRSVSASPRRQAGTTR